MTVSDIAANACLRFVRQDAATVTLAKAYVRQRDAMLWDAHNWRQALTTLTLAVAAGTAELALGTGIERPLAVRWGTRMLDGIDHGTAMRLAPETFDTAGDPIAYIELPRDTTNGARIRLSQVPQETGTLLVLAKRRWPGLPDDSSEPLIAGIASALMAYALGDLWSYEGQETKATAKYNEANQLAERILEAEQNAGGVRTRLIPDTGIADNLRVW
ncbi:MAG TPA: hypothetical protein VK178_07245 [Opitutaceae bacterium]|nr:hypothetical protein [Opitutaceae bacterium]HLP24891.1 hypothetical protein [Acidobacteriota bacterium]